MPLTSKPIDGLFMGVTKQDDTNSIDGQVKESINMLHSVEKGCSRRLPTEAIINLPADLELNNYMHSYARGDGVEEYLIYIYNQGIRVFTTAGIEVDTEVTIEAQNYLAHSGIANEIFVPLTVGDTTFIINNTIEVAKDAQVDGTLTDHERYPFLWIKRSFDNGQNVGYSYTMNGVTVNSTNTESVASLLRAGQTAEWGNAGSIVMRDNNIPTGNQNLIWSDSYGSQASQGFIGTTQKIEDLPRTMSGLDATRDILMKIQGDPDNNFTKFWVKFVDEHWQETRQGGLQNMLDASTMPIKLVRLSDGTFKAEVIDWTERKVGDEDTASDPSFVGETISDIFFFKNRLCLETNENVVMSKVGEPFNFYPKTVTDVLDSDPIDVSVDTNSVAVLKHAIPFNDEVVLMSNESQFSLQSEKVLSPNDVSISNTTNYTNSGRVKPIALGNSLYFVNTTLQGTSLREYFVNGTKSNIALDVSGHVKGYVPNTPMKIVGSTNQDIIILQNETEKDTLYIYKFYNDGEKRIQTAWSKWIFGGDVLGIALFNNYLYLHINRGDVGFERSLERLDYTTSTSINNIYLDAGQFQYESKVQLLQPVLRDKNGTIVESARSPIMLKTLQITSTPESIYQIRVKDKIRERVANNFAVKDNKILLQGQTKQVDITIESVNGSPLEFHTYTFELIHNLRSKIV